MHNTSDSEQNETHHVSISNTLFMRLNSEAANSSWMDFICQIQSSYVLLWLQFFLFLFPNLHLLLVLHRSPSHPQVNSPAVFFYSAQTWLLCLQWTNHKFAHPMCVFNQLVYQSVLWNCRKVKSRSTSVSHIDKCVQRFANHRVLFCEKCVCVYSSEYLVQCLVPWELGFEDSLRLLILMFMQSKETVKEFHAYTHTHASAILLHSFL